MASLGQISKLSSVLKLPQLHNLNKWGTFFSFRTRQNHIMIYPRLNIWNHWSSKFSTWHLEVVHSLYLHHTANKLNNMTFFCLKSLLIMNSYIVTAVWSCIKHHVFTCIYDRFIFIFPKQEEAIFRMASQFHNIDHHRITFHNLYPHQNYNQAEN